MASLPDNLPPEDLDPFYKALIYLGIAYFIATAFTSWLITRKRAKPVIKYRDSDSSRSSNVSETSMTQISFEDSRDILASLRVEIAGAESSLVQLGAIKNEGEISKDAYKLLHTRFSSDVTKLTSKMNEMLKVDIVSAKTGEVDVGISDDDMVDIEADLEKQLQELEDEEDFLAPRRGGRRGKKQKVKTVTATAVKTEPKHEKVQVTNPPPPTKASIPPPTTTLPPPEKPTTAAPPPTKIGDAMPTPTQATSASVEVPPAPPPPTKSAAQASTRQAAQPMKVEQADPEKEKIFAKSTSIAALRMDMLRELARLKKLINEDE